MRVKPAPGLKVRDPVTKRHLPETGKEVPSSTYWLRRLAVGDVIPAEPAPVPTFAPDPVPTQDQE